MPELPEVETTKSSLKPLLNHRVNKVAIYQPKLRWPIPENLPILAGSTLTNIIRRAKYLILTFKQVDVKADNDDSACVNEIKVIIHLGMSGSLQQYPIGTKKRKHDHLMMTFVNVNANDTTQLHYHDPRRFGAILWHSDYSHKLLNHLGIEPLDEAFNGEYLYRVILGQSAKGGYSKTRSPRLDNRIEKVYRPITRSIKAVIMDQSIVVGVGNIYATESLFMSAIHPVTPANTLDKNTLDILVGHIKFILSKSIEQGGSTLKDFTVANHQTGYFQQSLNVYGKHKQSCPICGTTIEKIKIVGRASTFCPQCQPIQFIK